jgi:hypothetical protein
MLKITLRIVLLLGLALAAFAPRAMAQAELFDGQPTFAEGTDLGYFVWRDGETWHVRWLARGKMMTFSGSVVAEGGELKSLKRIDLDSRSQIVRAGRAPHVVRGPRGGVRVRGGRAPVVVTREQDKVEKDGDNRIRFHARTDDDADGFDFKVEKKVTALRFMLEINGQARPQIIEIGKDNRKAPTLPLVVRLN